MDLELFRTLSKYPFIHKGVFYDTVELLQNKTCLEKCETKDCLNLLLNTINKTQYNCSKGYDNTLILIGDFKVIVNGLIFDSNIKVPAGRKHVRQAWIIKRDFVQLFITKIEEIEKHLIKRENETIEKNFSMFHDFKTSMNIFFNCTEDIINSLPGGIFEEKLSNSDDSHQALYHSLRLITTQLGMIDVVINPVSISFGTKREINIYKLFDKMRLLFGHLSAKKRNVTIELTNINGAYINNSYCFDSIEFIPLILIDNALKYSAPDSTIIIEIRQLYGRAKITVKNIGPFVSDENKEKIFDKFFRDEAAKAYSKEGIGMGLWVAQQILQAHQSKIFYYKDTNETRQLGLNIFEFELQTV